MSDTPTDTNVEVPEPAAEAPVDAAPAPEVAAEAVADTLDRLDGEVDQAYLERLKKEAISHRLRAKEIAQQFDPWKDAVDGWEEDQAEAVRQLLAAAKAGDTDTVMAILGIETPGTPEPTPPAAPPEASAGITLADVERLLAEREQKAKLEADIKAIEEQVGALGYEKGSNDYVLLFKIANEETNFDLNAAHEKVQAWKQSLVDQFVTQKANGATPPPAQGGPPGGERQIETLEDAKQAALARFGASRIS